MVLIRIKIGGFKGFVTVFSFGPVFECKNVTLLYATSNSLTHDSRKPYGLALLETDLCITACVLFSYRVIQLESWITRKQNQTQADAHKSVSRRASP